MMDSVSKVCELLIELVKTRKLESREHFEDHVEPVMKYMVLVHEDYTRAFAEICTAFESNQLSDEELLKFVREKKMAHDHIRQLVGDLARTLGASVYSKAAAKRGTHNPPKRHNRTTLAYHFARSVQDYLTYSPGQWWRFGTRLSGLVDILESVLQGDRTRCEAGKSAAGMRDGLPEAWGKITRNYAALREACLART